MPAVWIEHSHWVMAALALLLAGAVVAAWLVRGRERRRLEKLLADVRIEQRILQERLQSAETVIETRLGQIRELEVSLAEARSQVDRRQEELRRESAALAKAEERAERLAKVEAQNAQQASQMVALQEQLARSRTQAAELSTLLDEERKQTTEKIALLNGARDQLKAEFQDLAQRIFEEKSTKFADQNRNAVDQLIRPLREQIGDFKRRVEDVYDKETRDRTALQAEIHHLKELNQKISKEAVNLTRALKGDSKTRGNWGEVVLERVLEASGLQKGREYDLQVTLRDPSGRRFQPDAIVRLPEDRDVIVDAKVSLNAYESYFNAEDPREKDRHLTAHIDALRQHIRSLAGKRYDTLEGVHSLDFTLMFVPIEAAFLAAVEREGALFAEAFEKNIIMVSPSTLLVTLRTIHNIWRYEYQNRYAQEIAAKAGGLYDKFVGFVEALEEVGAQLERARNAYRTAHDRLVNGRGNLVSRTEQLKALGARTSKALPDRLLISDEDHNGDSQGEGQE